MKSVKTSALLKMKGLVFHLQISCATYGKTSPVQTSSITSFLQKSHMDALISSSQSGKILPLCLSILQHAAHTLETSRKMTTSSPLGNDLYLGISSPPSCEAWSISYARTPASILHPWSTHCHLLPKNLSWLFNRHYLQWSCYINNRSFNRLYHITCVSCVSCSTGKILQEWTNQASSTVN